MKRITFTLAICLVACSRLEPPAVPEVAQTLSPVTFPPNALVVWGGDSTSDQGRTTTLIPTAITLAFPNVQFSGWYVNGFTGATCGGIAAQFPRMQLPRQPDVFFMLCGINNVPKDVWTPAANAALLADYTAGLKTLRALYPNAQIVWSNIMPIDPDVWVLSSIHKIGADAQNAAIAQYNVSVTAWAASNGVMLIDIYTPVLAAYEARHNDGLTHSWWMTLLPGTTDGLHYSWEGAEILKEVYLDFLGVSGPVADVSFDALAGNTGCLNCVISGTPSVTQTAVSWRMTTDTLPWQSEAAMNDPGLPTHAPDAAIPYYPGAAARNALLVRIVNLTPGHYDVRLNNQLLGSFLDTDLCAGVDVSKSAAFTPKVAGIVSFDYRTSILVFRNRYSVVGPAYDAQWGGLFQVSELANWHVLGGRDLSYSIGWDTYLYQPAHARINAAALPSTLGPVSYSVVRTGN